MAIDVVQICDAVVATLNGAALNLPFTARRSYLTTVDIKDIVGLEVDVIPTALAATGKDLRPRHDFDWQVTIWVQQRLVPTTAEVDPLMLLVQGIVDLFATRRLAGTQAHAVGTEVQLNPAGSLDTRRVFTAAILFTFRLTR